jgi:hypothetical protein
MLYCILLHYALPGFKQIYFSTVQQVDYRVSTKTNNTKNKKHITRQKEDSTRFLKLKFRLLKISTNLQTDFAARTHLAVGQWLEEKLNVKKFRMFRVGTRKPTASRTEGQNLVPL